MSDRFDRETQEAAFTDAGSQRRLEILEVLHAAARDGERPLPFSTIWDRVDIADRGQLGYHLRQLDGRFVERREDGYVLRSPGRNVVQAAAAGTFVDPDPRTVTGAGPCPNCGAATALEYEDGWLTVRCPGCEHSLTVWSFPPRAAADRDDRALVDAFDRWVRNRIAQVVDGVCPDCGGRVTLTETTTGFDDGWLFDRLPLFECRGCYAQFCPAFGMTVLDAVPVRSFHRERDCDLRANPFWTVGPCVSDAATTAHVDPLRVTVRFSAAGETLAVHLDDDLTITDTAVTTGE